MGLQKTEENQPKIKKEAPAYNIHCQLKSSMMPSAHKFETVERLADVRLQSRTVGEDL